MKAVRSVGLAAAIVVLLLAGCAVPQRSDVLQAGGENAGSVAPKRITAATLGAITYLRTGFVGGQPPGARDLRELVSAGLTRVDRQSRWRPLLGEAVPSVENGLWNVFPDGRMETTWRIKETALWHDRTPVTADDLVFTIQVENDPGLPIARNRTYSMIEDVSALDSRTVTVKWRQPYIHADTMFSYDFALPMPKHLLESAFLADKAAFIELPFWSEGFVGAGPYRLKDFVRDSHLVLQAFDGYPLGRPRVDEIDVKFIADADTLLANLLAGTVELTIGRGLSIDQALQVRDLWKDGTSENVIENWVVMHPQFVDARPSVVTNAQFRRALVHATDRQELVNTFLGGLAPVAHVFLSPDAPEYKLVEGQIVRYEYDPRRAAQLIESLGYRRGGDGIFSDASGSNLSVEIRAGGYNDLDRQLMPTIADYWKRVGVQVEPLLFPLALKDDNEWRAKYPAFEFGQTSGDLERLAQRIHSSATPAPENRWSGSNRSRYKNAEFDDLLEGYTRTIPTEQRVGLLGQIVHQLTDLVLQMGLFYAVRPTLVSNRIRNTAPGAGTQFQVRNAHEWDVR